MSVESRIHDSSIVMKAHVQDFLNAHSYVKERSETQGWLIACSGGADSVALAHLAVGMGYAKALAHVNYGLRGAESDADEDFVRNLAASLKIPCFVYKPGPEDWSEGQGLQDSARKIRYAFFNRLLNETNGAFVATAHHSDDQVETFFLRLLRSSGAKGLAGMQPVNGNIIRPLLMAGRGEISNYLQEQGLPFRQDSSNLKDDYQRNLLRNQVLPLFQKHFPDLNKATLASIEILGEQSAYLDWSLQQQLLGFLKPEREGIYLYYDQLLSHPFPAILLKHWLMEKGFSAEQCVSILNQIRKGIDEEKRYFGKGYSLHLERNRAALVASDVFSAEYQEIISSPDQWPVGFKAVTISGGQFKEALSSLQPDEVLLDAGLLDFPLVLRSWKSGDRMHPRGISGSKLLSDLFTEKKWSERQKRDCLVLADKNDRIIWVPGLRCDKRFMATDKSARILKISTTCT